MTLRVNNNIASLNASMRLNANNRDLNIRLERLSSGLRINRAADDVAGLSIREGMRAEISGLKMNVLNAEQGSDLLQVAEGSLNEINAMLIRMRELAVQSASSTVNDRNRESIQAEYTQIINEIDRVAQVTTYNDQVLLTGYGNTVDINSTALTTSNSTGITNIKISGALTGTYIFADTGSDSEVTLGNGTATQTIRLATMLDGSTVATGSSIVANFDRLGIQVTLAGSEVTDATGAYSDGDLNGTDIVIKSNTGGSFQVGPDDGFNNRIEFSIEDMRASGSLLSLNTTSVATIATSRSSISQIDHAINNVANQRGDLGAFMNRLRFAISWTENSIENIQKSEASISDADVAAEVTAFTRSQILSQYATAMLAHANAAPQSALTLLQ